MTEEQSGRFTFGDIEIETRTELAKLVEGRSTESIEQKISEVGVTRLLTAAFTKIARRYDPAKSGGRSVVIRWQIFHSSDVHEWYLLTGPTRCEATSSLPAEQSVNLTVKMKIADFARFLAGAMGGLQAFTTGKLRLRGDLRLAPVLESWFDQSESADGSG